MKTLASFLTRATVMLLLLASLMSVLQSCKGTQRPKYIIGVSQCSADIWREKQNSELRMGAYLDGNVELHFAAAYDSDSLQVQQIDSLVATGIDLLIVAPNQVATISPAIDRAYDQGIPVIVFERKTNSQKYTAFISADNYEMGRVMGLHVAQRLGGKGRVMEVKGLKGSSPAIERHKGFVDALQAFPDITLVAVLQGDWTEQRAYEASRRYKGDISAIDYVFGQNDRMAQGVRRYMLEQGVTRLPLFCGIDGLPGPDGGIQLVEDSVFDATYIYPTHGDRLLSVAINILAGRHYDKETMLMSALVTSENANALQMQIDEILRQSDYLGQLHHRADNYLSQLSTQRTITFLACGVIVLLLVVITLLYLYQRGKITLRRERVVNNLWNNSMAAGQNDFIARFKEVVEARLSDSELSVEDLAADMNLSRAQLYRKVKTLTGSSPVELLRSARLNRGYQLLLTSQKSVSEVAYAVGFTAPSYFTKCFKEEFGQSPSEVTG